MTRVLATDGSEPATFITRFAPLAVHGVTHAADGPAGRAQLDLTTAYNNAARQASTGNFTGIDLAGRSTAVFMEAH